MTDEQIYASALTRIPGIGNIALCNLIKQLGSATAIFQHRKELSQLVPGVSDKLIKALDCSEAFKRAEEELVFADKNQIKCLTFNDKDYPDRLRECDDAPIVLYYRGNTELNSLRVISIVGTRHATPYGLDLCNAFIRQLSEICPDALIVSGLAYGIDIQAHRTALQYNFPTVGVLAHGLDRIYPSAHRKTAISMMDNGGLLTEFMSGTNPDKQNFVKRNRIVAGMCDAAIVVESAAKGGALITAELAGSYHKDCFAFPGKVTDMYSAGCNELIKNNKASLIMNAEDFVQAMGWDYQTKAKTGNVQRELFPELSSEEKIIIEVLEKNTEGMQINNLVVACNIPISQMSSILFELEMKGVIRAMAGGIYRLLL